MFTPFPGEQTEAQRGETVPAHAAAVPGLQPTLQPLLETPGGGRTPPSRPPVSSGAPNTGNVADGLGIFSCLSPGLAPRPPPQRLWE